MQRILFIMTLLALPFASNATNKSRLISYGGYISYGTGFQGNDSAYYKYSGVRSGGVVQAQSPYYNWQYAGKYDTTINSTWDPIALHFYVYNGSWRTYDSHDNILTQVDAGYDTTTHTWTNSLKTTYTYDASFNLTSKVMEIWDTAHWDNYSKEAYTYSGNDMLTDTLCSVNSLTHEWIYSAVLIYTYDVHHNMITQTGVDWDIYTGTWSVDAWRNVYYFNGGFMADSSLRQSLSAGSWWSNSKDIYTYSSFRLVSDTLKYWYVSSGSWENFQLTSNTYSGSNKTSETDYTWAVAHWEPSNKFINSFDGSHNMKTHVRQTWNGTSSAFENYVKDSNVYNSYNQPTLSTYQYWNGTTWADAPGSTIDHYYYELYNGVQNTVAATTDIELYPNPANDIINVRLKWDNAQRAVISIYDMNGRPVRQWQTEKTENYKANIPVSGLSAGGYIISIQTGGETINRQFTVMH